MSCTNIGCMSWPNDADVSLHSYTVPNKLDKIMLSKLQDKSLAISAPHRSKVSASDRLFKLPMFFFFFFFQSSIGQFPRFLYLYGFSVMRLVTGACVNHLECHPSYPLRMRTGCFVETSSYTVRISDCLHLKI